jgi:hypothetical protein
MKIRLFCAGCSVVIAYVMVPYATQAQPVMLDDTEDTVARTHCTVALSEGSTGVFYLPRSERDSTLVQFLERRNNVWRHTTAHSELPCVQSEQAPAIANHSMVLTHANGTLAVGFREPSSPLIDGEGHSTNTLNTVMEVVGAGWVSVENQTTPAGVVLMHEHGAYCCTYAMVAQWNNDVWQWQTHYWGSYRNRPIPDDINHDGVLEWIARDEEFGALWSHVSGALEPLGIWRLTAAGFAPVTWQFRGEVDSDLRALDTIHDSDLALASWAAERRLLGRPVPAATFRARARQLLADEMSGRSFNARLQRMRTLTDRYVATHGAPQRQRGRVVGYIGAPVRPANIVNSP